jgi:hypothetical protein
VNTFEDIDKLARKIAAYLYAKAQLIKYSKICGGYLHYDDYNASTIDKDMAKDVRRIICERQYVKCEGLLIELAEDVVVAEEMSDIERIRRDINES